EISASPGPEVYFGTECYGPQASAITKRLLPAGTRVRLLVEPATDRVDQYGRLAPLHHPGQGRPERERPARPGRGRCAVLLRGTQGQVCGPARTAGAAGEGEEAWAVGTLPAHSLRPGSRGQHEALTRGNAYAGEPVWLPHLPRAAREAHVEQLSR